MKINYRPEIDGLRAISVIAVIVYHSQSLIFPGEFLSGGFIGVDIFFVISGYLISSIIFKELKLTKKFSFTNFYERRSRRILPALFGVLLFSIPLAYIFLAPESILFFCESIASSIFFISNIYFHFESINYDAVDSLYIPLLHTWSLSVEEQFYILFPISILIIYKIFKNHILFFLLLGFLISFTFSIWLSYNHPFFNFYMLPSRGWELLSGSILGYIEINFGRKVKTNKFNFLFPKIGFFLIIGSFFYFNNATKHPSILTFFPILGVALLIWFANKKELTTKILSSKHLVFVGLISYSLYLWHYPILAFLRSTQIDTNHILTKITFILIIFIISLISYSLIEKPCRDKKNSFKNILKIFSIVIFLILAFVFYAIQKNGVLKNYPEVFLNSFKDHDYRLISQDNMPCHDRLGKEGFCEFNQNNNKNGNIIILGDSIADALLGNVIKLAEKNNYGVVHMSYSGNLFLPNFIRYNKLTNKSYDLEKHEYRKKYLDNLKKGNNIILITGAYTSYFSEKRLKLDNKKNIFENKLNEIYIDEKDKNKDFEFRKKKLERKFISEIKKLSDNYKVILLYPLPQPPSNVTQRIYNNYYINKNINFENDVINFNTIVFEKFNKDVIELFDKISSKNIHKIYPHEIFCNKLVCKFYDNENIYFFDETHPSNIGSKLIVEMIFEELKKIKN